jgi:hypothetical protein
VKKKIRGLQTKEAPDALGGVHPPELGAERPPGPPLPPSESLDPVAFEPLQDMEHLGDQVAGA